MMNKIFGVKNITHLLYGFLICMPMLSILARTCYVAINKNAKDSYSGKFEITYKYETNDVETIDDLVQGNIYNITLNQISSTNGNYVLTAYALYNVQQRSFYYTSSETDNLHYFMIELRTDGFAVRDTNYNQLFYVNLTSNDFPYTFNAVFRDYTNLDLITISKSTYNIIDADNIDQSGTLDNAFEYSLSQFTKDNNLGNVDLFSWFTNLFLDQTNPTNQLYLGFVNWYLNYTLLVSSGYLLFLTLIWFVNYVRRILDKSMNQEYGGF